MERSRENERSHDVMAESMLFVFHFFLPANAGVLDLLQLPKKVRRHSQILLHLAKETDYIMGA